MEEKDCIFCKIIAGECPSYKIYENDYVYAFLDISKDCYGHTLVVPKTHCTNILDCKDECLSEVIKAVKLISKHYVDDCGFKGVNVINASGKEAQQSVFHLHFHILPRTDKNEFNAFPKLSGTDVDFSKQLEKLKME
jgi:histidine triad (HIT) family protein